MIAWICEYIVGKGPKTERRGNLTPRRHHDRTTPNGPNATEGLMSKSGLLIESVASLWRRELVQFHSYHKALYIP